MLWYFTYFPLKLFLKSFLEIANVGEAYLIFEKISVLPKVYHNKQAQQNKNTFESVLAIQTKHFLKCFWN